MVLSTAASAEGHDREVVNPTTPAACILNPDCDLGQFRFEAIPQDDKGGSSGLSAVDTLLHGQSASDQSTDIPKAANDVLNDALIEPTVEVPSWNEIPVNPIVPNFCVANPKCIVIDSLGLTLPDSFDSTVFLGGSAVDLFEREAVD